MARVVLYSDAAGSPGSLLAVGPEVAIASGPAHWETFTFPSPVSIGANTSIWVGLWGGGASQIGETIDATPKTDSAYAAEPYTPTGEPKNNSPSFQSMSGGGQWGVARRIIIVTL